MRALIFLSCLVATALARPDVGYNYKSAQQLSPHVHQQQLPVEQSYNDFAAPTSAYLTPTSASVSETHDHLQQLDNSVASHDEVAFHEDSYNKAYQHSSNSHQSGGYPYKAQTTIHKHIYVHVPPKEFDNEDVIQTRVHYATAPKQKHYKIVFIRAPDAPSVRPPVVQPPPQNEEKTLIYVLHKKPELDQDIVIPTPAPTKPSKPEVFFIKYKTQKEEAPVYGPPPSHTQKLEMEPRTIDAPVPEYGAPDAESFPPISQNEPVAPLTTIQPQAAQEQSDSAQLKSQQPSESYNTPTMTAASAPLEEPQPTAAAPKNQYLAPEAAKTMTPIVVEDNPVPSNNYGPPNQFFIKKKK